MVNTNEAERIAQVNALKNGKVECFRNCISGSVQGVTGQTDGQTEGQIDRQKDIQTDRIYRDKEGREGGKNGMYGV